MGLAQRFDEWAKQHEQRGELRGQLRGEAKILQRQLTLRFGELPDVVVARLKEANAEQLEAWSEQVLFALGMSVALRYIKKKEDMTSILNVYDTHR